ncbi:MAG TPA: hypothetical protein VIJ25_07825 [Methylococcales bacterium]
MADTKISALTAHTAPISTDELPIVDVTAGSTKKIDYSVLVPTDGWVPSNETWAYASASTITVPAGAAGHYAVGDRLKFTQHSVVKYAVVVTVADTLLTIAVNTDFVVEDTATYPITLNYYSHQTTPVGFPYWFAFAVTISWNSGAPSTATTSARFSVTGRTVNFRVKQVNTGAGTTNTQNSFTVPITPLNIDANQYNFGCVGMVSTGTGGNDPSTVVTSCGIYNSVVYSNFASISAKSMWVWGSYEI